MKFSLFSVCLVTLPLLLSNVVAAPISAKSTPASVSQSEQHTATADQLRRAAQSQTTAANVARDVGTARASKDGKDDPVAQYWSNRSAEHEFMAHMLGKRSQQHTEASHRSSPTALDKIMLGEIPHDQETATFYKNDGFRSYYQSQSVLTQMKNRT
jgi:hypothetical protein